MLQFADLLSNYKICTVGIMDIPFMLEYFPIRRFFIFVNR